MHSQDIAAYRETCASLPGGAILDRYSDTTATDAQPTRYAVSVTAVFTATFESKSEAENAAKLFEIKPHGGWDIHAGQPQVELLK